MRKNKAHRQWQMFASDNFFMTMCRKFLHFPEGVSLVCHSLLFVQLLALGKTAQADESWRVTQEKK